MRRGTQVLPYLPEGSRLLRLDETFLQLIDELPIPDEDGCPLVDVGWTEIEQIARAVRAAPPGLLGEKGQRCTFVQEP